MILVDLFLQFQILFELNPDSKYHCYFLCCAVEDLCITFKREKLDIWLTFPCNEHKTNVMLKNRRQSI